MAYTDRMGRMARLALLMIGCVGCVWGMAFGAPQTAAAATISEAREAIRVGDYATAITLAEAAIEAGTWSEQWPRLLMEAQLTTGQYEAAVETFETAMDRYTSSLQLRMLAVQAYRFTDQLDAADSVSAQIFELLRSSPSRYSGSENLITAGRYFMSRGEDARKILELFFDRVREREPGFVETYVATAELALSKYDDAVAADALGRAAELAPDDPQIAFLAARAWQSSDQEKAELELRRALEINPNHVPSLLQRVNFWIDREQYSLAEETLARVEGINPRNPLLWAYRSVLAHLRGDSEGEQKAREQALSTWSRNPEVDYLIGKKLSQKYRFAEGAAAQRRALAFNPNFTASRFQLAQDLLRLGNDDAGWELAEWANREDGYNVVAYNLMTLRDSLRNFSVLKQGNLLVRMEAREAEIYGPEVLELLSEAERVLCEKYDIEPSGPVVVEIFPRQQDFAIRTFGLPGGDGFLGVCFGRVITANSPASQGADPANWQAVLWHEFCHVVTLGKTNNRMPRWLSEGISVYEERLRNPTWGQQMTPYFRKMILGEDAVPISKLSGAFLAPKSAMHLQLAYFESSLAVEFLIEKYGLETLNRILVDLGVGMPINESLERYSGSLATLDEEFLRFVRARARVYGCRFDWSEDDMPESQNPDDWRVWLEPRPDNYWGLRGLAASLMASRKFAEAKVPLERIFELFPADVVDTEALAELAATQQALQETAAEQSSLEKLIANQSDGFPQLIRLLELSAEQKDWQAVRDYANQALAINPLLATPHERIIEAAEALDRPQDAARALEVLGHMDPIDPALLHYRTARAWLARGNHQKAKRQVLMALEEAPHYRSAQSLLIELNQPAKQPPTGSLEPPTADEQAAAAEPPASEEEMPAAEEQPVTEEKPTGEEKPVIEEKPVGASGTVFFRSTTADQQEAHATFFVLLLARSFRRGVNAFDQISPFEHEDEYEYEYEYRFTECWAATNGGLV
ncbi:peptidase MA family metallohydrolase [Planctomycetaceae bacterium SH139]